MLLDRDRILRDFYRNLGTVSTGPFSPVTPQSHPGITPIPFDMEGAKRLFAQAGWRDRDGDGILENPEGEPFEFEFTYPQGSSSSPRIAKYVKDQCATVGIRMTERVVDRAVFFEALSTGDFDAITLAQSLGFPESDPHPAWHSDSIRDGANISRWQDNIADTLIERGRRTMDATERAVLWHELHRMIHEAQPFTFLVDRAELMLVSKDLRGADPSAAGLDLRNAFLAKPRAGR